MLSPKRHLSYWFACGTAALIYRISPWTSQEPRRDPFIWMILLCIVTSRLSQRLIFQYQSPFLKLAIYYTLLSCTMFSLGSLTDTLVDNHTSPDLSGSVSQERRKVIIHLLLGFVVVAEAEWRVDRVRLHAIVSFLALVLLPHISNFQEANSSFKLGN